MKKVGEIVIVSESAEIREGNKKKENEMDKDKNRKRNRKKKEREKERRKGRKTKCTISIGKKEERATQKMKSRIK